MDTGSTWPWRVGGSLNDGVVTPTLSNNPKKEMVSDMDRAGQKMFVPVVAL